MCWKKEKKKKKKIQTLLVMSRALQVQFVLQGLSLIGASSNARCDPLWLPRAAVFGNHINKKTPKSQWHRMCLHMQYLSLPHSVSGISWNEGSSNSISNCSYISCISCLLKAYQHVLLPSWHCWVIRERVEVIRQLLWCCISCELLLASYYGIIIFPARKGAPSKQVTWSVALLCSSAIHKCGGKYTVI